RTIDDGAPEVQVATPSRRLWKNTATRTPSTSGPRCIPTKATNAVFIELPQTSYLGYAAQFREKAAAAGKKVVVLPGDIRLIENLMLGNWDAKEYLIVPPGAHQRGRLRLGRSHKGEEVLSAQA